MWQEFKTFVMRGNVVDLAVGIIIGAAFTAIVTSLVNDVLMPPIGYLVGGVDFSNVFFALNGQSYPSLAAAQEAGAVTINIGRFLNAIINFLIVAVSVFLLVRWVNRLMKPPPQPAAAPSTKTCPFCYTDIPIPATRCPHCTSQLEGTKPL